MTSERYHKAAKDGLLDVLKEANRREVNVKDIDGMTPVLWAAFEGRLDALRLLVGRGGDPDKSDQFGNTALHLSAAKGHLQCVDFLVKFGVNIYALDIDRHNAKDLAAINNREDILRYLDSAAANMDQTDKKRAKSLKELADKNFDKRIKEYTKKYQKIEQQASDVKPMPHRPSTSVLGEWKQRLWSSSQGNLKSPELGNNGIGIGSNSNMGTTTKFSTLVGGTISGPRGPVQRKTQAMRAKQQNNLVPASMNDFKIGEVESTGKRSLRSLQGVRRDSEVIYVGTFSSNGDIGKRGKITDVFDVNETTSNTTERINDHLKPGVISRSFSQPNFFENETEDNIHISDEVMMQRPSGLFDRPMLGSLAFRRSVTAALDELHQNDVAKVENHNSSSVKTKVIKPRFNLIMSDSDSADTGSSDNEDDGDRTNPLERFLAAWGLQEYFITFQKQEVDLDTLLLLTENDLKSLGLPLGPFRRLVIAIQERKNALTKPGNITDSRL